MKGVLREDDATTSNAKNGFRDSNIASPHMFVDISSRNPQN